ncbi:protein FAR1-RELATED SEQUENCE 3 isoform X2 [Solanum dulcamara]|uniref:protein FAR1-RELATED SEQUENCE 3 isoform X2 n=1 Tax=Solanum dulcamara TaxID=45834 RepID=UPI0024856737|nr:protein FAR1-RELATED SEQUENCE 3 isoform X2 [Solanum dulcamara]
MDVEVIDVEVGNMHQQGGITDDGDDEPGESGEANVNGRSNAPDGDNIVEPQMGMVFLSGDQAKKFYDEYARRLGFTTRVSQFNRLKTDFLCDKVGLRRVSGESCDAMLRVELKGQNKWVVTKYVKDHSHSLVYPNKVHYRRSHKHFSVTKKNVPENNQGVGIVPSGVMYVSVDGNRIPAEMNHGAKRTRPEESDQNVKNTTLQSFSLRHCNQRRTLGRDAQNLLDYFKKMQAENPGFYYAIQLDEDNRMSNVFWADARSRNAYSHFGDAVVLDTMYRVNQCRVPFTPLTGVNHHGLTILFGCALLLDESEATFVWLFKTFLAAMNDRVPVSIITDQDTVIQSAVAQVFPETRHCINKWHVLRGGQDRMAHVCHMFPNFQVELYNCINLTETVEEFESYWEIILDKYDLKKNDWLQSIYNTRRQWVPVYFRDTFFAAVSCNQEYECSFFDGYVSQQITLPLFFRQYERALENSFEKETEADFDTICTTPPLRTPSPMEKQAATLYTKKIFLKFQEELVETFVYTANRIDGDGVISTFRVAKFEDDQKAYLVSLNISELKANCSCQMFECSGILCRHILTVFTVTNILTLPSHYILKRWTINAKCGAESDERVQLHGTESMAQRYNSLCKEAIRCAEEGAVSQETYNAALGALKGGVKKAALAKRNVAKVSPPSSQASCVGYDDPRTSTSASEMTPLLWPRQDEMTKRFNLNDTGSPARAVADLNPQRMAPVSLHRDDGHADNMLQDYIRTPSRESEVKFQLSQVTLEPMLKSMAYISEQLSAPANRVAVINLKLQDTETTLGESEVKFQVSRDTLGAMLRSMAYIREQLSNTVESQLEIPAKKQRK